VCRRARRGKHQQRARDDQRNVSPHADSLGMGAG
jgi:hypothetical protein